MDNNMWSEQQGVLRELAEADLAFVGLIIPTVIAFRGEKQMCLVEIPAFKKADNLGDALLALIDATILTSILKADRFMFSTCGMTPEGVHVHEIHVHDDKDDGVYTTTIIDNKTLAKDVERHDVREPHELLINDLFVNVPDEIANVTLAQVIAIMQHKGHTIALPAG